MIIDSRRIENTVHIDSDICIIGAGAAGITIALESSWRRNLSIVLLESGGESFDPATQSLYAGEQIGLSYDRLEATRSRFLGGSTNCWGGWCRPLDDLDFEERDWVPGSGWPFSKKELIEYYKKAHSLLQLKEFNYDVSHWTSLLNDHNLRPLPIEGSRLSNMIIHLSGPARFGSLYRQQLEQASNVKLMLFANATEICTDYDGVAANGVRVETLNARRFFVSAKVVVLAAGGIENARLLLLSSRHRPHGLGNKNDLVGRYFMDHPRIRSSRIRLKEQRKNRRLYDSHMAIRRGDSQDTRLALHVAPTAECQRMLRLPNSRTYLASRYAHEMSDGCVALTRLLRLVKGSVRYGYPLKELQRDLMQTLPTILANAPGAIVGALGVRFNPSFLLRDFEFETIIEPIPNFDSRVSLTSSLDRLGLNQVKVDWRLTEQDRLHFSTLHEILVSDLPRSSALNIMGEPADLSRIWPGRIAGCWHHMGTTRMSNDPAKGVVDANCRVHGMSNLFIAGSSIFPTVGSDMPTITIVALALRLCGHIQAQFDVVSAPLSEANLTKPVASAAAALRTP